MSILETLDVGQANELKLAFRKHGLTNEEVKRLCEGGILTDVREVLRGHAEIRPLGFLVPVGTVEIPGRTTPFAAKDHFIVNRGKDASVKISYLGDNFRAWFLGKTEQPCGGSTLRYAKLTRPSLDPPIIAELGGEAKAEISLGEFYALLLGQPNGEAGLLLTDGRANIFYVRDTDGVLCAVSASWYGGGWGVYAFSVSDPVEWRAGCRVFSRNPSAA